MAESTHHALLLGSALCGGTAASALFLPEYAAMGAAIFAAFGIALLLLGLCFPRPREKAPSDVQRSGAEIIK